MTSGCFRARAPVSALAVARLLIFALPCSVGALAAQEPPDLRQDMIRVLAARGPLPALGAEALLFDRLVGTWDCDYTFYDNGGAVTHSVGELRFGWILDGQAIQDVWITYPQEPGKERGIGTSIRFFDDKSKNWRIVFVDPANGALITVRGGAEGDRIVLRGVDDAGTALRWSFDELRADSFVWRGETSRDGGKTWKLEEEHHMRRRPALPIPAAKDSSSGEAFAQLARFLVGKWNGVHQGTEITLTYTLTASDSALMEEFRPKEGPVMITMFSVDGDHLLATHYCSAGNQPHMATETITEPESQQVAFTLTHVTGLKTPEDWHNIGLALMLEDDDHLTQEWTYQFKGQTGKTLFHFTRAR